MCRQKKSNYFTGDNNTDVLAGTVQHLNNKDYYFLWQGSKKVWVTSHSIATVNLQTLYD